MLEKDCFPYLGWPGDRQWRNQVTRSRPRESQFDPKPVAIDQKQGMCLLKSFVWWISIWHPGMWIWELGPGRCSPVFPTQCSAKERSITKNLDPHHPPWLSYCKEDGGDNKFCKWSRSSSFTVLFGFNCPNQSEWEKLTKKICLRYGVQKNRFFLGKSPKLWVGGGQES